MEKNLTKIGSWIPIFVAKNLYSLPIDRTGFDISGMGLYVGYPHLLLRFFLAKCAKMPIKDTEVLSAVKAIRMVMASSEF